MRVDPAVYLPPHWAASPETKTLARVIETQLDKLRAARDSTLEQMSPAAATWAMDAWERAFGIQRAQGDTQDFRRARLIAKIRGQGTTTVALVRDVATSYTDLMVEVDEYSAEYRVEIRFIGAIGTPVNLDDLARSLLDVLPAHLVYNYQFLHNLADMEDKYGFFVHMGDAMYIEQEAIS